MKESQDELNFILLNHAMVEAASSLVTGSVYRAEALGLKRWAGSGNWRLACDINQLKTSVLQPEIPPDGWDH